MPISRQQRGRKDADDDADDDVDDDDDNDVDADDDDCDHNGCGTQKGANRWLHVRVPYRAHIYALW